jgi:hypothetical protein
MGKLVGMIVSIAPKALLLSQLFSHLLGLGLVVGVKAEPIPLEPITPSMWWIIERSPQGWVESFSIDRTQKLVKVIITPALWNRADYLQRFALLRQLGQEAQKSGYGVILFNPRQQTLAEYQISNGSWQFTPPSLGAFPFRRDTP